MRGIRCKQRDVAVLKQLRPFGVRCKLCGNSLGDLVALKYQDTPQNEAAYLVAIAVARIVSSIQKSLGLNIRCEGQQAIGFPQEAE